jgi:hypothetical protein
MARQPPRSSSRLPREGARIGARVTTSISRDISRMVAGPSETSRTMARAITIPAQPPRPWTKRQVVSQPISAVSAQPMEPVMKMARPTSSGGRRPKRSASGPKISWAMAMPAKKVASVFCTAAGSAARPAAMAGKAGRYMSVASGPKADMAPRTSTSRVVTRGMRWLRRCASGLAPRAAPHHRRGGSRGLALPHCWAKRCPAAQSLRETGRQGRIRPGPAPASPAGQPVSCRLAASERASWTSAFSCPSATMGG